jgi:hypothetical protein
VLGVEFGELEGGMRRDGEDGGRKTCLVEVKWWEFIWADGKKGMVTSSGVPWRF